MHRKQEQEDDLRYYRLTHGANIPVRWTSPEALKEHLYTHASDVWSYGVLLWELWTNASTPYEGMTNEQVWMEVGNGYRLPRPDNCPEAVYENMMATWEADATKRPSFADIVGKLRKKRTSSMSALDSDMLSEALGETVTERTGLIGLSAHQINVVARKKFLRNAKDSTTTETLDRLKRLLKSQHTSYCNFISRQPIQTSVDPDGVAGYGEATVFVSHAWKYPFRLTCEVIGAYAKEISKNANASHHPGCSMSRGKGNRVVFKPYFWFDIFTVNQFEAPHYDQSFWTETFKNQVKTIGHTLLILHPWDAPIPFTRAWCVWEMVCFFFSFSLSCFSFSV